MALDRCIPDLIAGGQLDQGRADEVAGLYADLERVYRRQFGDQTAKAMASAQTVKQLRIAAAQKKRQALLQVQAQKGVLLDMASRGGPLEREAALVQIDRIQRRHIAIKGRLHGYIDNLLATHRRTITGGVRDRAGEEALAREAFGEASGNANAGELAGSWGEAAEYGRQRYNAAGGHIGKLDKWGLPQSHDSRAVAQAGFAPWRDFIAPLLDRDRMIDERTGAPFSDQALELALRNVYETIRTDGWSKIRPGSTGQGKMLANQNAGHRFLHFRDADAWLAYRERFGSGTVFDAMMGHIDAMSRDIAAMELFGPNPDATVKWLKDAVQKAAALAPGDQGDRARGTANSVQRLWDEYTGELGRPESRKLALGFGAVRSVQTSAKLGSAMLSAVSDLGFGVVTRKFNGLPAAGIVGDYWKLFKPGALEDQKQAIRAGLVAETWSHIGAAQNRYLNEELTGEVARRLAGTVLKVSGLERWTQAGRWAFGMELLGFLTDNVGKRFDELPNALQASFQRYGIAADGWERIRATPLEADRGADWLYPKNIEDQALGDRLLELINSETDYAVPIADLRTRAMMNSVAPKGTLMGEAVRSALLFKSFGISVMLLHGRRIINQSAGNAAAYAGGLVILTTLAGAMALQAKEVAKGKDPRPMDSPGFWGAALLQGGGFGIFGDFIGSSENRFGGGLATTIAGPMVQTAQNVGDLTVGNASRAIRGDKTKVGADVVKLIKQETPGGSLWYARLAFERLVADQLQSAIDPDYRKSWRRMEAKARKQGQGYWWDPGEVTPDRAPAP